LFAGVNHFIHPEFYLPLIPPYFEYPQTINLLAGIFEILAAIGLFIPAFRSRLSWLIIIMLIAFIPSHIYFIQIGANVDNGLSTPMWIAYLRLLLIHPLLLVWAYRTRKF
jgi:uncharacterized membrane protein